MLFQSTDELDAQVRLDLTPHLAMMVSCESRQWTDLLCSTIYLICGWSKVKEMQETCLAM